MTVVGNFRIRRLIRSRRGVPDTVYEQHFADQGMLDVALEVRTMIRDLVCSPDFVVLPGDDLQETLLISMDDIEDSTRELLQRFGRTSVPQPDEMAGWPPTRTVEDWVRFIVRFEIQSTGAGRTPSA
jgi:hypothetical protein